MPDPKDVLDHLKNEKLKTTKDYQMAARKHMEGIVNRKKLKEGVDILSELISFGKKEEGLSESDLEIEYRRNQKKDLINKFSKAEYAVKRMKEFLV